MHQVQLFRLTFRKALTKRLDYVAHRNKNKGYVPYCSGNYTFIYNKEQ